MSDKKRRTRKLTLQKTGDLDQCQCSSSCMRKCFGTTPFCEAHQNKCSRVSPLSGFEPDYNPEYWNKQFKIKETHNCFAYSFNINDNKQINKCNSNDCDIPFHQPGLASGYPNFSSKVPKTCPNMMARLFGDNPFIKMATFKEKCPVGTSKIALIIDQNEDYHFLRQDSNKFWSHKPGARKVTNRDSSGRLIYDPALANFNYKTKKNSDLNYDIFCSYICVPRTSEVKLKSGGSLRDQIRVGLLYTRRNDDSINIEDCMLEDWRVRYSGETEIEGFEYEVVFTGPQNTLEEFTDCLTSTFRDYKKNKVIRKYMVVVVRD